MAFLYFLDCSVLFYNFLGNFVQFYSFLIIGDTLFRSTVIVNRLMLLLIQQKYKWLLKQFISVIYINLNAFLQFLAALRRQECIYFIILFLLLIKRRLQSQIIIRESHYCFSRRVLNNVLTAVSLTAVGKQYRIILQRLAYLNGVQGGTFRF